MDANELKAMLAAEKADALSGMDSSDLGAERSRAMDYYLGDMASDMPAPDGRSKAVSTDVADVVEGLMPPLMEIFAGGDRVVEFSPVGPEDEEAAKQETDYVNHVFMQKNPGFVAMYSYIKDALLSKNGFVKVRWERSESEDRETYANKAENEFAIVAQRALDGEIKIEDHTANEDGSHNFVVVTSKKYGCARVYPVPPEEVGISRNARALRKGECTYAFHSTTTNEAALIDDGFDPAQVKALPSSNRDSGDEEEARNTIENEDQGSSESTNRAARPIERTEHYVLMSYKDDEPARLYQVTTGGAQGEILKRKGGELAIDPIDDFPIVTMTPIMQTHRVFGRSIADIVLEIQRIKTALLRQLLDNAYLANNQRVEVAEEYAGPRTIDDLLTNRIGGMVRTKRPGGILPIANQSIGNFAFPLLEYIDTARDNRTGITKQSQGLDSTSLQNETATKTNNMFAAAQARVKLIARIFAETGVRDLFSLLHQTIRKNDNQQHVIKLRNKWVPVDPRAWKTRDDMTINVGLGIGTKDQQVAHLLNLLGVQERALAIGVATPKNVYEAARQLPELLSLKNADKFFTDPNAPDDPENPKPAPRPSPEMAKVQGELQLEQQKALAKHQSDQQQAQAKMQADAARGQQDYEIAMAKISAETALKREQIGAEMELKRQQLVAELELKREQFAAELSLQRELGHSKVAADHDAKVSSSVHTGGEPG